MGNNIDVSIIIVNYNSFRLVKQCIHSIFSYVKETSFEIIVVDNNSEKESVLSLIREYENIKVICLHENVGFGRANNEGIKLSTGRNLFFLNPDTLLLNDAVSILSEYLDTHPQVVACGGNLYDSTLSPTRSFKRCYPSILWLLGSTFFYNCLEILLYGQNRFFNRKGRDMSVAYIVGADLMIKKKLISKYGGFNPNFFMYYEEIELCYRFSNIGYKIMSVPMARIQHMEGKTSSNIEKKAMALYTSSQIYYRLTHPKWYFYIMKLSLFFMIVSRISICFLLRKKKALAYWKIQYLCFIRKR